MKKLSYFLGILLFLFLGGQNLFSQEIEDTSAVEGDSSGLVSFDFKDADVRNVLRIFAHKTGINIVASPDVQGSVTVKLSNVPWEKALKIILEMNDFAYVKEGNVIKVLTRDRIAQEPLKTEVIPLDFAKASQVQPVVQSMLSERGSVKVDDRANLLIITDVPSSFEPIMNVVKRLDLPTPQVLIETKLIETTLDLNKKFGFKWSFLDDYGIVYNGLLNKTKTKSITDGLSMSDGNTNSRTMTQTYTPIVDPNRTIFTNTISDYTQTGELESGAEPDAFGTAVQSNEISTYQTPTWLQSAGSYAYSNGHTWADTLTHAVSETVSSGTTLGADGVGVLMSALMTDDGSDILSAPSIVTMDNKKASIKIATDVPMPSFAYNEETGRYEITGFTQTPIGITMEVTPKIAPNGYVTMDLKPEISATTTGTTFSSLGVTLPNIDKETLETSVMVKDGDTVILGGLMKQLDVFNNQKVPILHSIPVLGWLFKSKEKEIEKRNLLIFVTPTIIKDENSATITQNASDRYTKVREGYEETTSIYPDLEEK